jgi:sugar phosphate isomerase/epimerase
MHSLQRREFLSSMIAFPAIVTSVDDKRKEVLQNSARRLKISLNAYSFNDPLVKGDMDVFQMIEFCAATGFDAVDITGYYLKGYPAVPDDEYLFRIRRAAFAAGLEISGTGVRNDFTYQDKTKRAADVVLVKQWVDVAVKMGAPVLRIFAGNQKNENIPQEKVTEWMLDDIRECVEYAKTRGVIIGIQNHADFIQTADQVTGIIEKINSEWFGLILDTGSYRIHDPYEEIKKSIRYAVNWQVKEKIFINGKEVDTDIPKLISIIKESNYNGYLPIETLGQGDPKTKIAVLYSKVRSALQQ